MLRTGVVRAESWSGLFFVPNSGVVCAEIKLRSPVFQKDYDQKKRYSTPIVARFFTKPQMLGITRNAPPTSTSSPASVSKRMVK